MDLDPLAPRLYPAPDRASVDEECFLEWVLEALEHLYDYVYLQTHPLAAAVAGEESRVSNQGATLHRILLEVIEQLKPPVDTPGHSHLWRRYHHAILRYVEGATVARVAEELGVSDRQARRDNRDALQAISRLLQRRLARSPQLSQGPRSGSSGSVGELADGIGLEKEVARIGALESQGPTRLEEVIAGVLNTIANLARERNMAFDVQVSPDLPPLSAERMATRQIVLNVLLGGLDLSAPGGSIKVAARAAEGRVELAVGPLRTEGDEQMPRADERLEIGTRLAQLQGGSLEYGSEDQGQIVRLTLPAARLPTVLLIDDNPSLLRLLRRYLGGTRYSVVEAQPTQEEHVLRLARELQPDVITLDVMMPVTDGWELLQMLRAHPQTKHIPVVVCSVLKERDLALSLGAADFLAKPVTREELLGVLARLKPAPVV